VESKTDIVPSIPNLTSARPLVEGPVWTEQDVTVKFRGQETWPCETQGSYDTTTGLQGSLAYIREAYQYRLAVLADGFSSGGTPVGRLYLTGVIEFFQPSYGTISGLGVVTAPTEAALVSTSAPSMVQGAWKNKLNFDVPEHKEKKESNPDDPIVIPPAPILKRAFFSGRMTK